MALMGTACHAQSFRSDERIGRNGFWDGWFLQAGLDMSLQNPYGYNFSKVFPNGKSFGLDGAIGKWFTPSLGFRGKLNWENGFPPFENHYLEWIGPFGRNGINMDKGGYLGFYGEVLLNLHGLFAEYDAVRKWNAVVYPRAGIVYNLGLKKGAPLLGAGFLNTYRLNDRWSLYADVAYQMCASGFVGSEYVEGTGMGSNSNGYFDFNVGVQYCIGDEFHKADASTPVNQVIPSMWDKWFVQVGLDMSLQNPYGCNFSEVFPKGKSFGVDVAIGKWFTSEVALRGHLYWENGLIENKHLEWIAPGGNNGINHDKGGYLVMSIDALFNLHNIFSGYDDPDRRWHASVYPRAGLIRNFGIGSASPLLGAGIENTYKLTDGLGLYADFGYQVTTSESSVGLTGMSVGEGSNGFFNLEAGVVINLSK